MAEIKASVAVVTDSACDLPQEYFNAHPELYLLPLRLNIGEKSLRSGVDISTAEVLSSMERGHIPKTSLPSPEDLQEILEKIRESGIKKVLFVLISSALSGTCGMVRAISSGDAGDMEIEVYDTRILSMGLGYHVMGAIELIESGVPFEALRARLDALHADIDGFFYIPTLKFLSAGGRIGGAAKYLGNLMNIKPIIACDEEGRYYPRHICIGAKRTMAMAKDDCLNFIGKLAAEVTVLHAGAPEDAEKLMGMIKSACAQVKTCVRELSPALAVHVGRGMLAVCTHRIAQA